MLEIGRERKYELYDLFIEMPEPLVPRHLRLEVPERMKADGASRDGSTPARSPRAVAALVRAGRRAPRRLFLHAYANPRARARRRRG